MRSSIGLQINNITVIAILAFSTAYAMAPSPQLSFGKQVYSNMNGASQLNDQFYFNQNVSAGAGSWVAYNVGSGPSRILVSWNSSTWYSWADGPVPNGCSGGGQFSTVSGYTIATSSNSTNGVDGDWTNAAVISDNQVSARATAADFSGKSWVKITFTGGTTPLNEVEVSDISDYNDSWFFLGNSIAAAAFKLYDVPSFSQIVHDSLPAYFPAMVRGGIPCIHSWDVTAVIDFYMQHISDVHYVAIEVATNDAWGGNADVTVFRASMKTIIETAQAAGMEPIIARPPATAAGTAGWQVNQTYVDCVDDLTAEYGLTAGPDLFTWFLAHPEELEASDGVHPNSLGAASINRLWAEKMLEELYHEDTNIAANRRNIVQIAPSAAAVHPFEKIPLLAASQKPDAASFYTMSGKRIGAGNNSARFERIPGAGIYIMRSGTSSNNIQMK
jgi:hypothetical protein